MKRYRLYYYEYGSLKKFRTKARQFHHDTLKGALDYCVKWFRMHGSAEGAKELIIIDYETQGGRLNTIVKNEEENTVNIKIFSL